MPSKHQFELTEKNRQTEREIGNRKGKGKPFLHTREHKATKGPTLLHFAEELVLYGHRMPKIFRNPHRICIKTRHPTAF